MNMILRTSLLAIFIGVCLAFPRNSDLRFVDHGFEDDSTFTKVQKYAENDTDAELNMLGSSNGILTCPLCKIVIKYALWKYRTPQGTYDGLPEFVTSACIRFRVDPPEVCKGMIGAYKALVLQLEAKLQLSAEQICGLILPETCYSPDLPWNKIKWNITLPGKMPKRERPQSAPSMTDGTMRVLQISDLHLDLKYKPGAPVDCKEPLCCRETNTAKSKKTAGYWGTLGYCDTPYWTLENLLQNVSHNKYDFILWTGDLPAHNDWNQSKQDQISLQYNLTQLLLKYFPHTPIYPSLGNHESYPVNSFPPGYIKEKNDSISWLYKTLAKAWQPWLPNDALQTVAESAYYTVLVKPKFRIISMNMNYCNNENFWMLVDPVDPNHQLQWLVEVLTHAEQDGEKVHVIGHIAPGDPSCLPVWSHNFNKIINRFQDTVTGQFYGHEHSDQMEIFYDEETKRTPTNVAYLAPSVTSFISMHPGYREYIVDPTWNIVDHFTYILNLTKANNLPPGQHPEWELLYSAKGAYGLPDLSAQSWNDLLEKWISGHEESLFQKYYYYFYKGNPPATSCDKECKKTMLCSIRSARSGNSKEFCADL